MTTNPKENSILANVMRLFSSFRRQIEQLKLPSLWNQKEVSFCCSCRLIECKIKLSSSYCNYNQCTVLNNYHFQQLDIQNIGVINSNQISKGIRTGSHLVCSTLCIALKCQRCYNPLQFFHVGSSPWSKVFTSICNSSQIVLCSD